MIDSVAQRLADVVFFFVIVRFYDGKVDFATYLIIIRVKNEVALGQGARHSANLLDTLTVVFLVFVSKD